MNGGSEVFLYEDDVCVGYVDLSNRGWGGGVVVCCCCVVVC